VDRKQSLQFSLSSVPFFNDKSSRFISLEIVWKKINLDATCLRRFRSIRSQISDKNFKELIFSIWNQHNQYVYIILLISHFFLFLFLKVIFNNKNEIEMLQEKGQDTWFLLLYCSVIIFHSSDFLFQAKSCWITKKNPKVSQTIYCKHMRLSKGIFNVYVCNFVAFTSVKIRIASLNFLN